MPHHGFRVAPGTDIDLDKFDPAHHGGLSEPEGLAKLETLKAKLEDLQELLYASGTHSALIVLQGPDTSGKDGTIRMLSTCMNVQHTSVSSFKQPTPLEANHDFLWRIHSQVPQKGNIAIFNRSHYEDVLVVRVHDLVPKSTWKERYRQINGFEENLAMNGTIILKFFLHISKDEQERRLMAREEDKSKAWKLSAGDWKERQFWDDYMKSYQAVLSKCSTEDAPWFITPSNHKWYRNLCIVDALVTSFEKYRKTWEKGLHKRGIAAEAELRAFRAGQ
jgi:PPK2 family polyphosphate:nucleotide phosphotransferase